MLTQPMSTTATRSYADESSAQRVAHALDGSELIVADKQTRIVEDAPPSPYTTLDMLEDAALLLGWGGRKTMAAAQTLFEQGQITYPRSDSTEITAEAAQAIQEVVVDLYGVDALPHTGKSPWRALTARLRTDAPDENETGSAGKAHEAIRPTDPAMKPEDLVELSRETCGLYRLIWQRGLASQMRPARYQIIEATFRVSP